MTISHIEALPPWGALLKRITISQLGDIQGKRILDFGSGTGFTANYYAKWNRVTAVEPSAEAIAGRFQDQPYTQLAGGLDVLSGLEGESFDLVLCHNVLEYADRRDEIVRAFHRLLRPGGVLSLIKHNRAGRVMQMAVLLDDFDKANALLDGKDSTASQYGTIHYYEDGDLARWCGGFTLDKTLGIRAFWGLQQNQALHGDAAWQEKMISLEARAAELSPYRDVAFFHHLLLTKH